MFMIKTYLDENRLKETIRNSKSSYKEKLLRAFQKQHPKFR